jgi:hypothetical protein
LLVKSFCHGDRTPDINNLREEGFILLTVSEVSVHHGLKGELFLVLPPLLERGFLCFSLVIIGPNWALLGATRDFRKDTG